jgi:SAM-dependent methyltransferase
VQRTLTRRSMGASPDPVAASWDVEYRAGRYALEEPIGFVEDILQRAASSDLPAARGIYIGCGNGRNYLPLVADGLDLVGLDVSAVALAQLSRRAPDRAGSLVHGDLSVLAPDVRFSIVIGIQVFQHGRTARAHAHIADAARRVLPGGLLCIRVNAFGTDIYQRHRVIEQNADGGFTIEYRDGPKEGLAVHFFAEAELSGLLESFDPVLALRTHATERKPPKTGRWLQWEGIWRRQPQCSRP